MAGTEDERHGAELTRDALAAADARNAHLDEFPIQGWERGSSEIRADGAVQDCIALPRSPNEEVSGELVDLGYGLPADFERDVEGKVVMVRSDVPEYFDRYIHGREKYYYAVSRMGPHSDHWPFVQWGVPGYHVMSDTGQQGRGWGHTFADILDKVDIREQAIVLTELVADLTREDVTVEHRPPEEIAAVVEEDRAAGIRVIGDRPYDD